MAKYLLIKDGLIQNTLEIDPQNIASEYMLDDAGHRYPVYNDNGVKKISRTMFLVPEGFEIVQSDIGDAGQPYPLPEPTIEQPVDETQN
jgi:hypothetical protein